MRLQSKHVKIVIGVVLCAALLCVGLFLILSGDSTQIVEAPAPPRHVNPMPLPPPIPSLIAVQAQLPIQDIKPLVESALRDYLRKPIQRKDGSIESFIQLTPGQMTMTSSSDGTISAKVPFQFSGWAEASKKVFGRTISKREDVDGAASAALTLRLILNPDWRITAQSRINISIQRAEIKILGITVSIRTLLTKLVREKVIPKLEELIVTQIARVDVKTHVLRLWEKLHEPIVIREEPPIALVVEPLEAQAEQLSGDADTVTIRLGIKTYIHVHIGGTEKTEPLAAEVPPLPELRFIDALETGYHIIAPVEVAYTAIEKLAKPHVEKTHRLKGIEMQVQTLALYGSGSQLVAGITFKMPAFNTRGKLYLLGTPTYDVSETALAFSEFNYALTTQSLLLGFAKDVGEGFFPNLRTTVEQKLSFPIGTQLTQLKQTLSDAIENRRIGSYVVLRGSVDTVAPEALYLTQSGVQVWVRLQGQIMSEVDLETRH